MQLFSAAGWPSVLLLIASIYGVAVIIDRAFALREKVVCPPGLVAEIIAKMRQGELTQDELLVISKGSALGAVLAVAIKHRHSHRDLMKEAIEEQGRSVVIGLEKHVTALGTIATVSPLLGLLGTVVGMILLFGHDTSLSVEVDQLAHGISVALYNTAFGLVVAIPSMIFYRYYRARIDLFAVTMEQQAIQLVDALSE